MPKESIKNQYATKDDLKEMSKEIGEDFKTHLGVIYEKFHGDVKLLAEQMQGTDHKIDNLDHKVNRLESKVDAVEAKVDTVELKVDKLETKVDKLETKVDKLETKVDYLTETVGEIKMEMTEIKEKLDTKADVKEHQKLARRVTALEAKA